MPLAVKNYDDKIKRNRYIDYFRDLNEVSSASKQKYKMQADFFKKNIEELAGVLTNLMGNKGKIFFIYHPYFLYSKNEMAKDTPVSDILANVLNELGIPFYDTTSDLKIAFKDGLKKYYIAQDAHFNYEGLRIYSNLIAQKIIPTIEILVNEKK